MCNNYAGARSLRADVVTRAMHTPALRDRPYTESCSTIEERCQSGRRETHRERERNLREIRDDPRVRLRDSRDREAQAAGDFTGSGIRARQPGVGQKYKMPGDKI